MQIAIVRPDIAMHGEILDRLMHLYYSCCLATQVPLDHLVLLDVSPYVDKDANDINISPGNQSGINLLGPLRSEIPMIMWKDA